jgi:drug/metabolite transporter (DMT)-like permease
VVVQSDVVEDGKGRAAVLTEVSLLLAVFFLGTNPVAVKFAVTDVPPLPFVAIRFVLARLLLLPQCFWWAGEEGSGAGISSRWRVWGSWESG